jgi:ParB family chromosome partitioning protein
MYPEDEMARRDEVKLQDNQLGSAPPPLTEEQWLAVFASHETHGQAPPLFAIDDHTGITATRPLAEDAPAEVEEFSPAEPLMEVPPEYSRPRERNDPYPPTPIEDHSHFEIRKIPIDRLVSFPGEPRRHFDPEAIRSLAESIKKDGLTTPLQVTPYGDKYVLLGGNRRWRALQLLGISEAEARVVTAGFNRDQLDLRNARRLALIDNLQREDLTPLESTMAIIDHVQEELGLATPDEAAELLRQAANGATRSAQATRAAAILREFNFQPDSFRSNRLRILKMKAHLREEVLNDRLAYTTARLLNKVDNDAERLQLTEHVITAKLSRRNVRALLAQRQQPGEHRDDARRTRVNRAMTRLNNNFQRAEAKLSGDQLEEIEQRIADLQRLLKSKTKP